MQKPKPFQYDEKYDDKCAQDCDIIILDKESWF